MCPLCLTTAALAAAGATSAGGLTALFVKCLAPTRSPQWNIRESSRVTNGWWPASNT